MPTNEEIRERARGFMVVGWVLVCFAFLILFFEPSSVQIGKEWIPGSGAALFVIGLLLEYLRPSAVETHSLRIQT